MGCELVSNPPSEGHRDWQPSHISGRMRQSARPFGDTFVPCGQYNAHFAAASVEWPTWIAFLSRAFRPAPQVVGVGVISFHSKGWLDPPVPPRSWMQRKPREARNNIWSSNASPASGQPWLKTTGDRAQSFVVDRSSSCVVIVDIKHSPWVGADGRGFDLSTAELVNAVVSGKRRPKEAGADSDPYLLLPKMRPRDERRSDFNQAQENALRVRQRMATYF